MFIAPNQRTKPTVRAVSHRGAKDVKAPHECDNVQDEQDGEYFRENSQWSDLKRKCPQRRKDCILQSISANEQSRATRLLRARGRVIISLCSSIESKSLLKLEMVGAVASAFGVRNLCLRADRMAVTAGAVAT